MDKYHIFNEIGAGKNSQVFKGRQKKTVTYVAVKRVAKDQMSKVVNEARSRRPAVLRRLHAIEATRVHQTRSWVVSWSILRPFGPRRATAMLFGRDMVASRWRRVDGVCERRRALHAIAAARASVLDAFRDCRYAQA